VSRNLVVDDTSHGDAEMLAHAVTDGATSAALPKEFAGDVGAPVLRSSRCARAR
jgi:hypothetical protein